MGVSGRNRSLLEHILESVRTRTHRESERMQIRLKYLTPLLAAGGAAAAPTGAANPPQAQESCIDLNSGSQCQSPGNVQINDSPVGPIYPYYGDYPFYGGFYGDYHGGYGGYGGLDGHAAGG